MKLSNLKKLAGEGKLKLHKYKVGNFTRNRYIYSKEKDICDQKLITIKKVPFTRYYYSASTEDMIKHQSYKITARDYKELLSDGAKEDV